MEQDTRSVAALERSKLSPISHSEFRKQRLEQDRTKRLKEELLPWFSAIGALAIEVFIFRSTILCFLFSPILPYSWTIFIEQLVLAYLIGACCWMSFRMTEQAVRVNKDEIGKVSTHVWTQVSEAAKKTFPFLFATSEDVVKKPPPSLEKSWIEGHHFGVSPARSTKSCLERSLLNSSLMSTSPASTSFDGIGAANIVNRSSTSPYTNSPKSIESIHTREQLGRLLRKKPESESLDVSSSSIRSGSFYNILDFTGGERKGYQLSGEIKPDGKEATSNALFDSYGRVHFSPIASGGDAEVDEMGRLKAALQNAKSNGVARKISGSPLLRRSDSMEKRRSRLSPERQLSMSSTGVTEMDIGSELLHMEELIRGEHRLRAWFVNTILKPVAEQIRVVNTLLEKEAANPPLRIGLSTVDALKAALTSRDSLKNSSLPFLLPYLSIHPNIAYVVSRIEELSADPFMAHYQWNSGGREPVDDKMQIKTRMARRPWGEQLPTDAMLIFQLFCAYMDSRLTSNPLVGSSALEQPFTANYTLKSPQKPSAIHSASGSFYVNMSTIQPPHWELITSESGRTHVKIPVVKGASNLFHAIVQMIHHAKTANGGRIDVLSIGPTGLGLSCILD